MSKQSEIDKLTKELPEHEREIIIDVFSRILSWLLQQQALESYIITRGRVFHPPEIIERLKARRPEFKRLIKLTEQVIRKITLTRSDYLADKLIDEYLEKTKITDFRAEGATLAFNLEKIRRKEAKNG